MSERSELQRHGASAPSADAAHGCTARRRNRIHHAAVVHQSERSELQHYGAFSSLVHRPSPQTIDHVAMVHQ
jgi:hypothetical protein